MSFLKTVVTARAVVFAFAAMGILWGSFAAVMPDLKAQLGVDEARLGGLLLFTPLAAVTAMLLAPLIGHRLGKVALPLSAGAMALAFTLPGTVVVPWMFPLAMMVCGFGTGLTDVLMNARTAELETTRKVHLMNLAHAAYSFGYGGGAICTGQLRGLGWTPDLVLGTMALLALVFAGLTFERDGAIHGLKRPEAGGPGLGLVPLIGGGMVLIAFLTENAAEGWSALHIEKTLGGSPEEGALGPAVLALTMGVARLLGQGLVARLDPFRLLMGGALVAACGALIASQAGTPNAAYAGFIIMGVGSSVIAPTAFSLVGRHSAEGTRARAVARATLYGYFGYFVGPPALGIIAGTFSLRAAFIFAAGMLMFILVLAPLMRRAARS
ncbi:MFS transporter [Paracoccus sp. IB05]|uniref:MFS transporter n=1 Tax=Paracoccus sp. IB05 TaxID=2779367 RepID=UPI0018E862D5|nr:MFS transporter [Paracoccus sp. IB05]MBJ2153630.1 MFS transporter [Paracoccus sp. IB05]